MSRNIFNSVKFPKVGSNWFDLTHDVKFSCDMGKLVPILCEECVPGDRWQLQHNLMMRFAPLVAPVMHRVKAYVHYFFVPNRLVWPNWEKFISPNDQNSGADYPAPWLEFDQGFCAPGTLADYLGLPSIDGSGTGKMFGINAIPFAGYSEIYRQFYRDQNLEDDFSCQLIDGSQNENPNLLNIAFLRDRAWMHDYFTSALPWPQKGDDVLIPIGDFSDVDVVLKDQDYPPGAAVPQIFRGYDGNPADTAGGFGSHYRSNPAETGAPDAGLGLNDGGDPGSVIKGVNLDPNGTLSAQTSDLQAEAQSIRTLRRAFKLQEWLERNARSGTRYVESIMAHFGVKSSDARLNRPEFIGGSSQPMVISEVLQTAEGTDPVGNMAGHGVSVGSSRSTSYYCEEHGFLFGILSVMPVTAYQQGVPKKFLKLDPLEYAWPTFQHIGEQEVKQVEVYAMDGYNPGLDGTEPDVNNGTWGYNPRYAEYKYAPSRVAGEFKTSLNHWHMGRIFDAKPALNDTFVKCDPTNRVFAVETGHKLWAQVLHTNKVRRKLAKYGNPML